MSSCPQCETDLSKCPRCKRPVTQVRTVSFSVATVLPKFQEVQDALIDEAIRRTDNYCAAAALIGMPKTTLYRRLDKRRSRENP